QCSGSLLYTSKGTVVTSGSAAMASSVICRPPHCSPKSAGRPLSPHRRRGGNNVILEIAPNVFAWYTHLRRGSLTVKVGDAVKAGGAHRETREHRPLRRPPPTFRSCRQAGRYRRTEPAFRLRQLHLGRRDRFRRLEGESTGILPDSRQVRPACPLYGGIRSATIDLFWSHRTENGMPRRVRCRRFRIAF